MRPARVDKRGAPAILAVALAVASCGEAPFIELQIADPVLPFLTPPRDFDQLGVEARREGCADTAMRYPPEELPATLTVLPGDCYRESVELRAAAYLGDRRVAESRWIGVEFPGSGARVVTATLADLPGRRVLFETGFEEGQPFGDRTAGLEVVLERGVTALEARVSDDGPLAGERSALLRGVASSSSAVTFVRVASLNLALIRGDELVYRLAVDPEAQALTVGVDLELSTGGGAERLRLSDRISGRPVHASSKSGRAPGVVQGWTVDLSAAAGGRLVGILLGFDSRVAREGGRFGVRIDDLAVVRP